MYQKYNILYEEYSYYLFVIINQISVICEPITKHKAANGKM